jgi:hypothetical protein
MAALEAVTRGSIHALLKAVEEATNFSPMLIGPTLLDSSDEDMPDQLSPLSEDSSVS